MSLDLDPDPDNILGRGILPPDEEARLLAEGVVFAMFGPVRSPKVRPCLYCSYRPIAVAATAIFVDLLRAQYGKLYPELPEPVAPAVQPASPVPYPA